jgi:hypothetical protein
MNTKKSWAETEFGRAKLGDIRRTKRLVKLAEQRGQKPNASIPQSCGDHAAIKGAYRLLSQQQFQGEQILASHSCATQERMQTEKVILAVQDTTQLDFTHHPSTQGLGYLQDLKHRGLLLHSTLAVTSERVPLGLLEQQTWIRPDDQFRKRHQRRGLSIEEKESMKWLKSLKRTAEIQLALSDTLVVSVGDSEADVYDLFLEAEQLVQHVLVRASRDRLVAHAERRLWSYLESRPVAGTLIVQVPRQADLPARTAELVVRYAPVTLKPPQYRSAEKLPKLSVWAVLAVEEQPPAEVEEPISWLLLSTVAINSFEQAVERIHWYTCRWVVEMYHKVLKSGCRVEERQFDDYETIVRYLAVDGVVAWRVLYLTMVSRDMPDIPCTVVLEAHEWQALYCFIHQTNTPPNQPPTLKEATRWIASLGGFLGRKGDKDPGMVVVWRGLTRLSDITDAWLIFHPPP